MNIDKTIEKIVKKIPKKVVFDTHFVINEMIKAIVILMECFSNQKLIQLMEELGKQLKTLLQSKMTNLIPKIYMGKVVDVHYGKNYKW